MDNLTHTLFALALSKTRVVGSSRRAQWALLVGANLPDLDAVALLWGTPAYMLHHRGISHSFVGILVEWIGLAAILRVGVPAGERRAVWWATLAGLLSHPLLDALNSYGLRPWLPISDHCYYGDLVFIMDPYLWILFGGAAAIAGDTSRLERWILGLAAGITTAIVYFSGRAPLPLMMFWPLIILEIVALRRGGLGRNRPGTVIAVMAAAFLLYAVAMGILGAHAEAATASDVAFHLDPGDPVERSSRTPVPGDPFAWDVIVESQDFVFRRNMCIGSRDWIQSKIPKNTKLPEVVTAASGYEGTVWRKFARHPVASVTRTADGRANAVQLMDARFGFDPIMNRSRIEVFLR